MASLIDAAGRPLKGKASPARTDGPQGPKKPGAAGALIKDSGLETFAADVLDTSMEVPVIVDFWAPWCGPCKQLGPMLERLVTEANGAVRLVKVNIDENPEIAQQLRIQSIPTVYAFKQGQPVDGFMGAIPESQLRQFIEGLAGPLPPGAAEEAADLLAAGVDALAKRDLSRAAQLFGQLLQEDPGNPKAVAGLARCYLESGDLDRARKTLKLVRPDGASDENYRAAEAELALKERAAAAGDAGQLNARVAANPADLAARFDLALVLDGRGAREAAIDQLLEIIRRDRKWNDDAARKHLLTLFDAMGPADPRTLAGRRRLSSILFS